MINYTMIGKKIKIYRRKAHMSQSELAERIDVSNSYISQLERGTSKASIERLDSIAAVLNVRLTDFFDDIDVSKEDYCNTAINTAMKCLPPSDKERLLDYAEVLLSRSPSMVAESSLKN